jgi:hypothetical protein
MKINKDFGMVMIDLSAKEVSMLLELIDLAIDTRTSLESSTDTFADLAQLSKKLNLDVKEFYSGTNLV